MKIYFYSQLCMALFIFGYIHERNVGAGFFIDTFSFCLFYEPGYTSETCIQYFHS